MIRFVAALSCAFVLSACDPAHHIGSTDQWENISVDVIPVAAPVETIGRLAYRGGVELRSGNPMFVGLSALEVLEDGRVVAISDEADWIDARLSFDDRDYLTGFTDVRGAFMRDERGRTLSSKAEADSEGLAQLADGRFAVSFERSQLIRIYDLNRDGPFGVAEMGPRLEGVRRLPANQGLEALAAMDDALLVGAEGGDRPTTELWLAPLDAQTPVPARFSYPLSDGFSLTGLDRLPDGDFVAIERFFAPIVGPRARITRFALPSGGGVIQKEILATFDPSFPIDNFEGISAARARDGATRIYIVSDNNKSAQQRALLLAFDIVEAPAD